MWKGSIMKIYYALLVLLPEFVTIVTTSMTYASMCVLIYNFEVFSFSVHFFQRDIFAHAWLRMHAYGTNEPLGRLGAQFV